MRTHLKSVKIPVRRCAQMRCSEIVHSCPWSEPDVLHQQQLRPYQLVRNRKLPRLWLAISQRHFKQSLRAAGDANYGSGDNGAGDGREKVASPG